jgi:hypothetical protein
MLKNHSTDFNSKNIIQKSLWISCGQTVDKLGLTCGQTVDKILNQK